VRTHGRPDPPRCDVPRATRAGRVRRLEAVTTFIAGVLAIRKGLAKPIGSLTQMGTVRLGKRTEGRSPHIKDVVPLAALDDLVFAGWDIFAENCYAAARTAGVLEPALLDEIRPELKAIAPMPRRRA